MICKREGRGFGYCKDFFDKQFPDYTFCGLLCQTVGKALADLNGGIIPVAKLTDMERVAVRDARQQFYEALVRTNVADALNDLTLEQIEDIITSIWNGINASMHRQSGTGAGPPF